MTAAPNPAPQAPSAPSYERYFSPQLTSAQARDLRHVVRAWAHRRGLSLRYDWRLDHAARTMLPWAMAHTGEPLPVGAFKAAAWHAGWTDGELSALAITTQEHALAQGLNLELTAALNGVEASHMGLAVGPAPTPEDGRGPQATVVLALSRRLLALSPVPTTRLVNGQLNLLGTLHDSTVRTVTVAALHPDGQVTRTALWVDHHRFMGALAVGAMPGPMQVELLADRGRGPEVAAAFCVQVETGRRPSKPSLWPSTDAAPQAPHHGQTLSALVWGVRQSHHLPLPAPHPSLMRAAQSHAEDMQKNHFFAHVSPSTGDVTKRLAALHVGYKHVVENIAQASCLDDAFAQWLTSPGHLQNLLDPRVDRMGVGVVQLMDASPPQTLVVLVMAQGVDNAAF